MNDPFVNACQARIMKINGLNCLLNMPKAVHQKIVNGKEVACALPEYNRRPAYVVDEYPACPQNWMKSSGDASSYFVPVMSEHGMWLDFNQNQTHTHDIAIVVSVQGINAVTGQKTDKLRLEQYKKKCPVHNEPFGHERYCEKCGFKWPAQNYLASNVTPFGKLWLDGFRAQDGEVRQYIFTEEVVRGIASQLIGDDRVFSIGVAFYLSKEPKKIPEPKTLTLRMSNPISNWSGTKNMNKYGSINRGLISSYPNFSYEVDTCASLGVDSLSDGTYSVSNCASLDMVDTRECAEPIETTKLEIGAGAKINQQIHADTEKLSYWQKQPAGIIYINYVPIEDAEKIISAGKTMFGNGEGFMSGLRTGVAVE